MVTALLILVNDLKTVCSYYRLGSEHPETFCILDGKRQLFPQLIFRIVVGHHEVVEACAGNWETVGVGTEPPNMERQIAQSIHWSPVTASRKLKEQFLLLLSHFFDNDFPEPLRDIRFFRKPVNVPGLLL